MKDKFLKYINQEVYLKVINGDYFYECVGIFLNENIDTIELGFNFENGKILDKIIFNTSDITEIKECKVDSFF